MNTIEKYGIVSEADKEANEQYYQSLPICDCAYCNNYYAQIGERQQLTAFFKELGVQPLRCDELIAFDDPQTETVDYIACYTVAGRFGENARFEFPIEDASLLLEPFDFSDPSKYFPNERKTKQDIFALSVRITLPWVLKDPFPTRKPFFQRIKSSFKRKTP